MTIDRPCLRCWNLPSRGPLCTGLEALCPGNATGPLVGGNLEVFSRLLGTPLLPDLEGAILFLEEVGERPYRIDRLLVHLELGWGLRRRGGRRDGRSGGMRRAGRFARDLAVRHRGGARASRPPADPVSLAAPIGHGTRNVSLPYGVRASLDARAGTLVAQDAVVR